MDIIEKIFPTLDTYFVILLSKELSSLPSQQQHERGLCYLQLSVLAICNNKQIYFEALFHSFVVSFPIWVDLK